MASFVDEIRKFNPYVQQLPIEAMVEVERYKQQKYDAGIQAIEQTRDAIAGLPVDSKYAGYVNSALTEFNNGIRKVAGADFSNTQLVNQIENSANQIASDPIIQSGVISAQVNKENQERMKDDRKNGKLTPDNEYDYQDEYAKWKQDTDLSRPFNYNYSTNIDINKKWLEVLKSINPTAKLEDIPFEIDQNGNIDYSKISTAMIERGYKGVSPAQLKAAISASLSEADMNQLRISAKYRFRGSSPDDLVSMSEQKYAISKADLSKKKEIIEGQLKLYPESTEAGKKLKTSLDYINEQLGNETTKGKLDIQREDENKWIRQNPDQAKTAIYKNAYVDQFSNSFSYMEESTKYMESPYTKYNSWLLDYKQKALGNDLAERKFAYEQGQDVIENSFREREVRVKEREKGDGLIGGFTTDLGVNTDLGKNPYATISDIGTQAFAVSDAVLSRIAKQTAVPGESENAGRARVNSMIADYSSGKLTNIPANIKADLDAALHASATGANVSAFLQNAEKSVSAELLNTPEYQNMQSAIKSRHALKIGNTMFTPEEVLAFLNKEQLTTFQSASGGTGGGGIVGSGSAVREIDPSKMTEKEKILYNYMQGGRYGESKGYTKNQAYVNQYFNDFNSIQNQSRDVLNKKNELLNSWLAERAPTLLPTATTIDIPKAEDRNLMLNRVSSILVNRIKADKGGNEGLDVDEAIALVSDKKLKETTTLDFINQPGNYQLVLKNGEDRQVIKLTDNEAGQFNPAIKGVNSELSTRLALGGGLTTNYLGTPEGAYYQKTRFPNVKNLNVRADLRPLPGQQDAAGNPMFNIEYNVQINGQWRKLELPTPITIEQAQFNIQNVKDEDLITAYKQAGITE